MYRHEQPNANERSRTPIIYLVDLAGVANVERPPPPFQTRRDRVRFGRKFHQRRRVLRIAQRYLKLGIYTLTVEANGFKNIDNALEVGDVSETVTIEVIKWLREVMNFLCECLISQKYGYKFALEAKPNELHGDIYFPSTGAYLGFINMLDHYTMVSANPEVGHE